MPPVFCTLFDINYLARGLVMMQSLIKHCPLAQIFVLCMDEKSYHVLTKLQLPYIRLIDLEEFEDEPLLAVKLTRTKAEYCWTCTPSLIRFVLKTYSVESCVYLDADLYFYQDPMPELLCREKHSVLLTDHFYTPCYDRTEISGRFCVQFMLFRNNSQGQMILDWWRERCLEWCFARCEEGKFGDQKYLDDWPERFAEVEVCGNRGYGVAPWNVQQYSWNWLQRHMIFFHFHGVHFIRQDRVRLDSYRLSRQIRKRIFLPYLTDLKKISSFLENKAGKENWLLVKKEKITPRKILARIWHFVLRTNNVINL